jgi:type I restriction enzyme S subunit
MTGGSHPMVPLGDLCKVQSGYAFKSADWQSSGVPVVQIGNVRPRTIDLNGCKFVSEDVAAQAARFHLRRDDILISMTGHIGIVGRVKSDAHIALNQRVGRFEAINERLVDPSYLFQVLQSEDVRENLVKLGYGAAQPNISPKLIGSVEVPLPSIQTQRRIASILGAYDDLIEVNRRRVAVLEEMARGLFEEWFVRFRFPGHESVPIIDTPDGPLPEGWKTSELVKILRLRYGKALKAETRVPGEAAVIGSSGVVGSHTNSLVKGPGIVVGRKGNVGSVIWSTGDFWPIDTAYFVETQLPLTFVFELLRRITFQNTDAAVPGLNRDYAHSRRVVVPAVDFIERFSCLATPLRDQRDVLERASERLAASRDLLLPRLISGQLSLATAERQLEQAA